MKNDTGVMKNDTITTPYDESKPHGWWNANIDAHKAFIDSLDERGAATLLRKIAAADKLLHHSKPEQKLRDFVRDGKLEKIGTRWVSVSDTDENRCDNIGMIAALTISSWQAVGPEGLTLICKRLGL